nr:DEAD/DEAH box helicase [Candidatus Sigynarchaeota archaeon]
MEPLFSIGQVVSARNRLWRIEQVINQQSTFEKDAILNLLQVSSIDGKYSRCCLLVNAVKKEGDKERVVPFEKIELAKIPYPDVKKLGNPDFQKVLIQAMRFDLIFGISNFISLSNSKVIPVSYQMVPVLMAMAQEHVRLLIADDVGLGKTIEAGLIIQELFGRKKINRVMFVVPASIREQWQSILLRFFGIDAKILSRQTLKSLQKELISGGEPWGYYNFIIVSPEYLIHKDMETLERAVQFPFDIIVIDEAHNVAKPRYMVDEKGTKKSKLLYRMATRLAKYPGLLMLTATPHNGYHESFASLIHLLKSDLVDSEHEFKINKEVAKKYICQRRKEDVIEWMDPVERESLFPKVHNKEVFITPSDEFKAVLPLIDKYSKLVSEQSQKDTEGVRFIKLWSIIHMYRRLISSPHALVKTIENKTKDDASVSGEALIDPNKLGREELDDYLERTRENITDVGTDQELEESEVDRKNDSEIGGIKLDAEIKKVLAEIKVAATRLLGYGNDAKLDHFYNNVLPELVEKSTKIIIFTRYIDTAKYLAAEFKRLANTMKVLQGINVMEIVGTDPEHLRREKYKEFLAWDKGLLVATDCMSEGIDLQYSSNIVVNWELTWNPNRLKQRNGRVDRFGQPKKDVYIRTLIMSDTIEIAILDLLYQKITSIGGDLGHVPKCFGNLDLIGDIITQYFQKNQVIRFGKKNKEERYTPLDYWLKTGEESEKFLREHFNVDFNVVVDDDSFYGQTTVDFKDVQERMKAMQESIGDIKDLLVFLQKALPFFGSSIAVVNQKDFPKDKVFKVTLGEKVARMMPGDRKDTGEYLVTIDPIFGSRNSQVETLSLKSPVLNVMIDLVKERGFLSVDEFYGRTAAAATALVEETVAIIYFKIRYLVNTKDSSLMEELLPIGFKVFDEAESKGGKPVLPKPKTDQLWKEFISGSTGNYPGSAKQVQDDLGFLLRRTDLANAVDKAFADRLIAVKNESKALKKKLLDKSLATEQDLAGMDDISIISKDPISITMFYPKGGR